MIPLSDAKYTSCILYVPYYAVFVTFYFSDSKTVQDIFVKQEMWELEIVVQ